MGQIQNYFKRKDCLPTPGDQYPWLMAITAQVIVSVNKRCVMASNLASYILINKLPT